MKILYLLGVIGLGKIKNSQSKSEIAEQLGFINDNLIYDLAARYSSGDNLNRGFSQPIKVPNQRTPKI